MLSDRRRQQLMSIIEFLIIGLPSNMFWGKKYQPCQQIKKVVQYTIILKTKIIYFCNEEFFCFLFTIGQFTFAMCQNK